MKDKIRDYIGYHGRVSHSAALAETFTRSQMMLGNDGIFQYMLSNQRIILHKGDPIIILQKSPRIEKIFYVLAPTGITRLFNDEIECENKL